MAPDETDATERGKNPGKTIVLGRVSGLYGVRGWVKLFSFTEPRRALLDYKEWLVGTSGNWTPVEVAEGRQHGKTLVARFAGTEDRDSAARYVGAGIAVERGSLPEAAPGEYYWADLEGLQVRHRDGRVLGQVAQMMATGAHDVIVVRTPTNDGGDREILIPFVPGAYVREVDLDSGVIEVDWEWD